ncbi:MAG: acyltransferase family protein [Caldicoprobacterales bacterium]
MEQLPDSPNSQHLIKTNEDYGSIEYSVTAKKATKYRDPYFCNLKFILISLVILGHLMEKYTYTNNDLYNIYALIYMVHMPLFAFISGYFSKNINRKLNMVWKIGGQFFFIAFWMALDKLICDRVYRRLENPLLVFLVPIESFLLEMDGIIDIVHN